MIGQAVHLSEPLVLLPFGFVCAFVEDVYAVGEFSPASSLLVELECQFGDLWDDDCVSMNCSSLEFENDTFDYFLSGRVVDECGVTDVPSFFFFFRESRVFVCNDMFEQMLLGVFSGDEYLVFVQYGEDGFPVVAGIVITDYDECAFRTVRFCEDFADYDRNGNFLFLGYLVFVVVSFAFKRRPGFVVFVDDFVVSRLKERCDVCLIHWIDPLFCWIMV